MPPKYLKGQSKPKAVQSRKYVRMDSMATFQIDTPCVFVLNWQYVPALRMNTYLNGSDAYGKVPYVTISAEKCCKDKVLFQTVHQ